MFSVRFGSDEVIKKKSRTDGPIWACGQLAFIYIYRTDIYIYTYIYIYLLFKV